jgi:hypothetical protein
VRLQAGARLLQVVDEEVAGVVGEGAMSVINATEPVSISHLPHSAD